MDYLRSAYSTNIWIHNGTTNLFEKIPITWFKAPTNAIPLGVNHQYGSANWQRGTPFPQQVGEVLGDPRTYSKGSPVNGYFGVNHCGSDNLWRGVLPKLTVPLGSNADGSPSCCGVACQFCQNGVGPGSYTAVLTGGTANLGAFNGTYHIPYVGSCKWFLSRPGLPFLQWTVLAQSNGMFLEGLNNSSTNHDFVSYFMPSTDCLNTSGKFVFNSSAGSGVAPNVQVTWP